MKTETAASQAWLPTTARWIAAVRERESVRADRLFDDPYARLFAGTAGWDMLKRSEGGGGENKFIPVRVRYFDDLMTRFASEVDQIVLLGAGYDTRALRLALPATLHVFELDAPAVIAEKEQALGRVEASCQLTRIASDFSESWIDQLIAAGFKPKLRTLWLAEGLFFYLSLAQVDDLLVTTFKNSGSGSAFAADISGSGIIALPQMAAYLAFLRGSGKPDPFTTADPTALFATAGWRMDSIVQAGQSQANFGRMAVLGDQLALQPTSSMLVTARKP